jgi:hypothetical protein
MESQKFEKGKKGSLWKKIFVGVVLFVVLVVVLALLLTKGIVTTVEKQLTALKKGDYYTAYALTSKDFKNTVSFEAFQDFVKRYPSLSRNKSHSFKERTIENNTGTLKGTLQSEDGAITPVEYKLVKEDGEWKILAITLSPTGLKEEKSFSKPFSPVIQRIDIGTMKDLRGVVSNPSQIFKPTDRTLNVSVYISNVKAGETVSATLFHIDSNSSVGPATNTVQQDYESLISLFEFTSPPSGWPIGKYTLVISLSDGSNSSLDFEVR